MSWVSLCELPELFEGRGKYVEIDGFQLAVFLHKGHPRVLDNECPHAGGDLFHGWLEGNCIVCPLHGWPFNLENGQLRDSPGVSIKVYPVRLLERPNQATLVQADLPMY